MMHQRLAVLILLSFLPSLSGCLNGTLHAKGELDVEQKDLSIDSGEGQDAEQSKGEEEPTGSS